MKFQAAKRLEAGDKLTDAKTGKVFVVQGNTPKNSRSIIKFKCGSEIDFDSYTQLQITK